MRLTILFNRKNQFSRKTSPSVYQKYLSWLTQRDKETRRPKETQFSWEKKYSIKRKMDSLWTPRNITSLDGSCYETMDSSFSQKIFSYLKMFSMQCRKNTTVEDNKERRNITNFINMYTNIYIPILMSATNVNKVSDFWASQNTIWISMHRSLRIQYLHLGVFLWKQYITQVLQVTKTFASSKVFVYVLLYYFTFQAPTQWNCHLHKRLLPDEVF